MAERKHHTRYGYDARDSANDNALLDLRFRRLLGEKNWKALPRAVKRRFSKRLGPGDAAIYKGYIQYTRMNRTGRYLAKLLYMIGAPLPMDVDNEDRPAIVTVTEDAKGGGQFWTRKSRTTPYYS